MSSGESDSAGSAAVPPPQHNFEEAARRAIVALGGQSPEQLEWLGAKRTGNLWTLPVLEASLTVGLDDGDVRTRDGDPIGPWWKILILHYLSVSKRPEEDARVVSFAELPSGRAYAPVYQGRVIERLCRTIAKDRESLLHAGEAIGGLIGQGGDLSLDFTPFPRVHLRLVWYAGDEELAPSAVLLLPRNIESFFCIEDIVVLSERIVSRLSGGGF